METVAVADGVEELEYKAVAWPDRANALVVRDQATFDQAAELLLGIKALGAEIDAHEDPNIKRWHEGHKAACARKNGLKAPLVAAETTIKGRMSVWKTAEDRRRQEEQRRLDEAARKAEEDARVAEAAALEAAGEQDLAERVLEAPSIAPPPVLPPAPKTDGIQTRKVWHCQLDDMVALCAAIGRRELPASVVPPFPWPAMEGMAKSLKEGFAVPGCRAVCETTIAAGRR